MSAAFTHMQGTWVRVCTPPPPRWLGRLTSMPATAAFKISVLSEFSQSLGRGKHTTGLCSEARSALVPKTKQKKKEIMAQ